MRGKSIQAKCFIENLNIIKLSKKRIVIMNEDSIIKSVHSADVHIFSFLFFLMLPFIFLSD